MSGRAAIIPKGDAKAALPIAARRHPLVREVDRQLGRCGLRKADVSRDSPRANVVIAVSGGADSVALLLACMALDRRKKRDSCPMKLTVAHVHHHLRDSADDDAAFVQELCNRLGLPCVIRHVQPRSEKGNLAAGARRLRYRALADAAGDVEARCVLVAHHADDQFETMLMAFCRGAGPRGMAGMKAATKLAGIEVMRPMLAVSKATCIEFCRLAGVEWREDPTNRDVSGRRARLRRDVTPVLEELWPGAAKRAARNSKHFKSKA